MTSEFIRLALNLSKQILLEPPELYRDVQVALNKPGWLWTASVQSHSLWEIGAQHWSLPDDSTKWVWVFGAISLCSETQCGWTAHRLKLAGKAAQLPLSGIGPKLLSMGSPMLAGKGESSSISASMVWLTSIWLKHPQITECWLQISSEPRAHSDLHFLHPNPVPRN